MRNDHDDDDDQHVRPCVPFVPFRCPFCGRHKPFTYAVRGRMRYHRCQNCNRKYRSWECGADSVTTFTPPPDPQDG
jgi:uncharacterized protein (DUF983 family)